MDVNAFLSHRRPLATPSGEIAYTELGTGPAALFVHGIGTSGALWRQVIEDLSGTSRCIAVDLPAHGASPARNDMSVAALAEALAGLCDSLGLGQVDLAGNDTGGAIAQVFAARHPGKLRTLTLTNCECQGNFPQPDFAPFIEQARQGTLAPLMAELAANPEAWPTHPLSMGYQYPDRVPRDAWRDYLTGTAGTIERARECERLIASLDAADIQAASGQLRALNVPTLLVWGTADAGFPVKWADHLRDLIPGAREVIEVDGAKVFFPEERPEDLVPHLRRHWGR
jgi:pimeloyl-ACP methyl ester carboxylesterase